MIANVTIYKYCKVEIGKNFIVDDIEAYLNSLSHYDYSDVQYQKIQFSKLLIFTNNSAIILLNKCTKSYSVRLINL